MQKIGNEFQQDAFQLQKVHYFNCDWKLNYNLINTQWSVCSKMNSFHLSVSKIDLVNLQWWLELFYILLSVFVM